MIRKPKIVMKEMAAPQAKVEVKSLLDELKDKLTIQHYVSFRYPFPATVTLKNPSVLDVTFNLMMSFSLNEKDKNFHLNSLIESSFAKCWTTIKKKFTRIDIRIRGANIFVSTDDYDVLKACLDDFARLWKPEEFSIIKQISK